jgi:hypothetical protein
MSALRPEADIWAYTGLGRCDHLIDFAPYGKCAADQAI